MKVRLLPSHRNPESKLFSLLIFTLQRNDARCLRKSSDYEVDKMPADIGLFSLQKDLYTSQRKSTFNYSTSF